VLWLEQIYPQQALPPGSPVKTGVTVLTMVTQVPGPGSRCQKAPSALLPHI
jgi:hypothetical protein